MPAVSASRRALDHFVCATHDVDVAGSTYERLGFRVLPKMRHAEIGSCNRIVQLEGTYFELVGDLDRCAPALRDRLTPRFRCGEGLTMTSLTSTDLPGDHRRLSEGTGFTVDRILNARRRIRMPDGTDDETDSHCFYVWHPRSTFLTLFFSAHYRPHTIWVPEYMRHPNGARRVVSQAFVAEEPLAERAYFESLLGTPPHSATAARLEFVTARGETVEVLSASALETRYGASAPAPCAEFAGYGVGLRYAVDDLDACRRLLAANGVPFADDRDVVTVAANRACGVVTEFVSAGPGVAA